MAEGEQTPWKNFFPCPDSVSVPVLSPGRFPVNDASFRTHKQAPCQLFGRRLFSFPVAYATCKIRPVVLS